MQTSNTFSRQFTDRQSWKPERTMLFVYIILGLSLCVFGASIWFSSYPKKVFIQRKPAFIDRQERIHNEIQRLNLEENTLTDVERIRELIKELGLVESSNKTNIEIRNRL